MEKQSDEIMQWFVSPSGQKRKAVALLLRITGEALLSEQLLSVLEGCGVSVAADHRAHRALVESRLLSMGRSEPEPFVWVDRDESRVVEVHMKAGVDWRKEERTIRPRSLEWYSYGADRSEYRCVSDRKFIAAIVERVRGKYASQHTHSAQSWRYVLSFDEIRGTKEEAYFTDEPSARIEAVAALALRAWMAPAPYRYETYESSELEQLDQELISKAKKELFG